jgi:hypothetical protein
MQTHRWIWITLVSLAGCGWHLNGQTSIAFNGQVRLASGTTLPAQCAAGQVFFKTNAPAGANLYTCIASGSWTAVGLSQGAAANRPANCIAGQIWLATDTGALTYCSVTGNPGTWSSALAGPAGPAGGALVVTTGTGAPSANCAAPSSSNLAVYTDSTNQDQWWCSATNTWKKILSVTGVGPYQVIGGTGAAPTAPASGTVACYFDSTTNTQVCLDPSGNAFTMVKGAAAVAHQFVTNIGANGIQTQAPIGATDLPPTAFPSPGTAITLANPGGIATCTGNCTVSVPLPTPGAVFCALTDDNVPATITFSALGSSAMYESAAHTGYGTPGTGTFAATAAIGNRACIVGRDSTHYLTYSSTGTWTAN